MFLQLVDDIIETSSGYQLTWVWRNRTSHQEVEVVVDTRWNSLLLDILPSILVMYNQVGDTDVVVADAEQLSQTRLTYIKTYHDNLLTQQGERNSNV